MKKNLFMMLLITCALAGCSKDDDGNGDEGGGGGGKEDKHITVSNQNQLTQTVYADQITGSSEVSFATTASWTSSITQTRAGSPDWISISPSYGNKGNHKVSVTLDTNYTGLEREAKITITCGGEDATITVTQKNTTQSGQLLKKVTGIELDQNTLTLTKGDSETLVATILPADATNKDIVWRSNDTNIATVDETGKVTAVKKGTARIYAASAEDDSIEDYCIVTVNNAVQGTLTINNTTTYNFETIRVSCGVPPLGPGYTIQYIALVTMEDLSQAMFSFSIYFDEKKLAPQPGLFTVGSIASLTNYTIFTNSVLAPGLSSSLNAGEKIDISATTDTVTITCNATTKNGNTISFSYSGTYDLFIEPGLE